MKLERVLGWVAGGDGLGAKVVAKGGKTFASKKHSRRKKRVGVGKTQRECKDKGSRLGKGGLANALWGGAAINKEKGDDRQKISV